MNRRGFLTSILAAGAAPFIVRAGSLMAVREPKIIGVDLAKPGMEFGRIETFSFMTSPPLLDPDTDARAIAERMARVLEVVTYKVLVGDYNERMTSEKDCFSVSTELRR